MPRLAPVALLTAAALVVGAVWFYYEPSRFVVVWLLQYPLLTLALLGFVLISWNKLGGGLGLNDLFWHRPSWLQLFIGFGAGAVCGHLLHVRYVVMPAELARGDWHTAVMARLPSLLWWCRGAERESLYRLGQYLVGLYVPLLVVLALPAVLDIRRRWLLPVGLAVSCGAFVVMAASLEGSGVLAAVNDLPWVKDGVLRVQPPPVTTGSDVQLTTRVQLEPIARLPYTLLLLSTGAFLLFCLVFVAWEWGAGWGTPPPVLPLIALAGFLSTLYGYVATREPGLQYLIWLAMLAAGLMANRDPHKLRVPAVADRWYKRNGAADLNPTATDPPGGLLASADVLRTAAGRWAEWSDKPTTAPPLPPAVVLAVSGGGSRSAVWTCAVLEELHRQAPKLAEHVRIITGASGGMVGAAYHTAHRAFGNGTLAAGIEPAVPCHFRDQDVTLHAPLARALSRDHLSPVVSSMLLRDLPVVFWPFPRWVWRFPLERDRGMALELAWERNTTPTEDRPDLSPFAAPLSKLRAEEEKAAVPSLVFSPMLVEDARRLLISNLDLAALCEVRIGDRVLSRPSVEFYKLFRDDDTRATFTVATAARLQASFPLVSPALFLPTSPLRRVVDAGYYDNYGVDLAAEWLYHHSADVAANASGVLLLEVRGYANGLARRLAQPAADAGALGWLRSPLTAVLAMRERSPWYRNDERVRGMGALYQLAHKKKDTFVRTETLEFPDTPGSAPLGWSMTDDQRTELIVAAQRAVAELVGRLRASEEYAWV